MRANVFKKAVKTINNPKASDFDRAVARHQVCLGVAAGEPYCLKVGSKRLNTIIDYKTVQ